MRNAVVPDSVAQLFHAELLNIVPPRASPQIGIRVVFLFYPGKNEEFRIQKYERQMTAYPIHYEVSSSRDTPMRKLMPFWRAAHDTRQ